MVYKVKNIKRKDKELKKIFKKCNVCGELLLINRFNNKKSCLDGKEGFCKICKYRKSLKYTKKNLKKLNNGFLFFVNYYMLINYHSY